MRLDCRDLYKHPAKMATKKASGKRVPFKDLKEQQNQEAQDQGESTGDTFVVNFGGKSGKDTNLQDAFLRFKKERQEELKQAKRMKELEQETKVDPELMWQLRMKFLEQAKKYFGVPYAKRYWSPEEEEYNSPIFLDCCGLIRQVLRDLREEFGFKTGPWNQAYQYDTLPVTLDEKDMKPGDLVFISATYFNPKSKKQRHNMVHVEIWLGDGPKTIGARWQRGKVQVFDSYAFEAKSYHSPSYIFKSIDTWLMGICQSYCDKHPWRKSNYDPSHRSVFSLDDEAQDSDDDEGAGDTDDELILSFGDERDFQNLLAKGDNSQKTDQSSSSQTPKEVLESLREMSLSDPPSIEKEEKENQPGSAPTDADSPSNSGGATGGKSETQGSTSGVGNTGTCTSSTRSTGPGRPARKGGKKSPNDGGGSGSSGRGIRRVSLAPNVQPGFYIGGGNGVGLVEAPLLALGWKRITDRHNEFFKLKWTECKSQINYNRFKEGDQLVNHIPNCSLLTNKLGLLTSLQEYSRVTQGIKGGASGRTGKMRMDDFVPETYRVDEKADKEAFLETYQDGEIWICKPTGMNQGKGIYLISSRDEVDKIIKEREERKQNHRKTSRPIMTRIMQRYITNPLLLDGHKFDIRAYMHIASTTPYVVLYHPGYIRRTCQPYNDDITDLAVHLTNQFVQKKVEDYQEKKDDTVWSMEQFNEYINEKVAPEKELEKDWSLNTLPKIMQKIMMYCFNSVKHKFQQRLGYFELFGFDFMIDTDMRVWLIEINTNPALHTNCEVLRNVLPPIVEESLYLSVECFEKKKKSQPLMPLQSLRGYNLMYHDDFKSSGAGASTIGHIIIPPRAPSPFKRVQTSMEKHTMETNDDNETKEINQAKNEIKTESETDVQPIVDISELNIKTSDQPAVKLNTSIAAAGESKHVNAGNKSRGSTATKAGWPSFMNKLSPRNISVGTSKVSLSLNTTTAISVSEPVTLKMTHSNAVLSQKIDPHKPIINRKGQGIARSGRSKSRIQDRSS